MVKRRQIKSALTRFVTYLDRFSDSDTVQLEIRLSQTIGLLDNFNNVQDQLEMIDETEFDSDERYILEERYFSIIEKAKKIVSCRNSTPDMASNAQSASSNSNVDLSTLNINPSSNARFPTLELPKFYGDYDKWGQFRDMFLSLVDKDRTLDNIKKFYYLISCLKGEAAKVIANMEITNENYHVAWDLLKNRYENSSVIIKKHVRELFEMPAVSKEPHSLRQLTDNLQKHLRSLASLGEPVESWSTMLIYLITKKLDFASERAWEEYIISKKIISPTITDDLIKFLNQRCQLLEAISREKTQKSVKSENNLVNFKKPSNSRSDAGSKSFSGHVQHLSCAFCKREHLIYYCDKLKSMPPDSRLREVNKMKRCTNCLRRGHSKSDCRSQGCKKCNGRHNTLLHDDNLRNPPATSGVARSGCQNGSNSQIQGSDSDDSIVHGNNDDNSVQSAGLAVNHCRNLEPQILLSTANILIKDGSNRWHECRALLDSGSQPNFITTRLMSQLRLDSTDAGIPVIGVGNSTTRIAKRVRTEIKSLNNDYSVKLTFLVLDEITECMPNFPFNKTELKIPKTVKLADSNFYLSSTIDILLGAGIFFDLLCSGRIKLGENLPVLQQTLLGWIISGPLPREMNSSSNFCNLAIEASLDKQIEKFWLLEEVTTQKPQSREEIECENVFVETTRRDDSGHFVVTLPTRENVHDLGENLTNAVQRLYAMERKFSKNVEFKQLYTSFMNEYERLGHMTRINESELHSTTSRGTFYLPHHGVIKNESTTTKLRVVFDG
nr:unnamed protein product [Callosobruchus chinensis]